jgi:hypothetical protein
MRYSHVDDTKVARLHFLPYQFQASIDDGLLHTTAPWSRAQRLWIHGLHMPRDPRASPKKTCRASRKNRNALIDDWIWRRLYNPNERLLEALQIHGPDEETFIRTMINVLNKAAAQFKVAFFPGLGTRIDLLYFLDKNSQLPQNNWLNHTTIRNLINRDDH